MKKLAFSAVLIFGLLLPYAANAQDGNRRPLRAGEQVIGTVQTTFQAFNTNTRSLRESATEAAYIALVAAANREHQGAVDVRDITWVQGRSVQGMGMFEFSANGRVISLSDNRASGGEQSIGTVQTTFQALLSNTRSARENAGQAAYIALQEEATRRFQGNIDVKDITWVQGRSVQGMGMHEYSAAGRVVLLGSGGASASATGIEGALQRAAQEVSESFTARSRIAIVYITAESRGQTDYITGELEHILRRMGYVIIDRSELDRIRAEQRLGASLEVNDATAARIGQFAGASVVITGRVDGEGNLRRLRLRALDTSSAQVVGTASERL
ncbi:MAG: CsgG/HfaB family protein [Treponema sp.]|nr:CsgG/HfaB family protein [Treponema sp.]